MKQKNKIISTAIASTLLATSGIAVMANNNTKNIDEDTHGSSIIADNDNYNDNDRFDLKMKRDGRINAFYISIDIVKLSGDVEFNENSYILPVNKNAKKTVKVEKDLDKNITTLKIAVVSDDNLSAIDGEFDLGTIKVGSGTKNSEYRIDQIEVQTSTGYNVSNESNNLNENSRATITLKKDVVDSGEEIKPGPGEGGSGGGESGGGSEGEQEKPEEKPPVKPEEPEKPGDNDNTGGSTGGGTSKPEKPEEEKPTEHNVQLFSMSGADRYETSTKISKTGWTSGAKNVVIVNGNEKNIVDGLSATPFASIKNAPVLLSNNGKLPSSTISELKRLNPTNVYVIGGTTSMPESVVKSIKNNTNATVSRIGGKTRYETSLAIAKQIDKIADVNKVYISSGTGEVDALSIASVAGRDKAPILLTNVNKVDTNTYNFIKSENVKNAYFIGGEKKISNSVIKQIDKVVSADVSKNRVAGQNRKDTNAEVIEKFYTSSKLNGVVVAKDDVIVDALTVGSFAAKNDMPVVIAKNSLSSAQKSALTGKKTEKVYQSGGGVKASVIDNLKELLGTKK